MSKAQGKFVADMIFLNFYMIWHVHLRSWKKLTKHFDLPLVAGCSIGYKTHPLYVIKWDASQTKKSKSFY